MTHQTRANNNVLGHIAGAKADSFAQAFVDRFAAGLKNTKRRGAESNDASTQAVEGKSSTKATNSDDEDSDGASGGTSQWYVCKFCESKAYKSREELKQHAATCEKNPNRPPSQRPLEDGDSQGLRTSSQETGGGNGGTGASANIQMRTKPSAGDQMLPGGMQQGNEMLEGFRKGINFYQQQMQIMTNAVNQTLPGTQQGGFPHADIRMNAMLEDYRKGINFYKEQMNMLTNQAIGQYVPYGHKSPSGISSPVKPRQHRIAKPVVFSEEIIEASKGPFRKLSAPVLLSLEEDKEWLTPLHCFVRKKCIEAFTATQADVDLPCKGKRKAINLGQVGIRCPYCHKADSDPARMRGGSVYYPNSLSSLYNAAMNLLQRHFQSCPNIPSDLRREYEDLKNDDARSGTSKKYWVESAMSLGFVDTTKGIMIRYELLSCSKAKTGQRLLFLTIYVSSVCGTL